MTTTAAPAGRGAGFEATAADFLRAVPLFSAVPEQIRCEIAERSKLVHLRAGDVLFREGDPADELYVLRSGRLEVFGEDDEPQPRRVLLRGAVVGELALLTGSRRSASVRARRESTLLELSRSSFDALLAEPEFARALLHALGAEVQESRVLEQSEGRPVTLAVLPLEPEVPLDDFCEKVTATLARWGSVTSLEPVDDPAACSELLDRCEREHDHVLLRGRSPVGDAWNDFCARQADRIFCLAKGGGPPQRPLLPLDIGGCDLVLCPPGFGRIDARPLVQAASPRAIYVLRTGTAFDACVEAISRRVAGRSLGLVLSGGGARGLAHVGVLDELCSHGVEIDRVAGCSMGAFIGGMFAAGRDPQSIRLACEAELLHRKPLGDYTVPSRSLLRGKRGLEMLERVFGSARIEELEREFFSVSCDLVSGELVVHRRGPVVEAVAASMSLPGILPPVPRDGRLLVDGGVLNNLPVQQLAASAEGPVVAVDVTAQFGGPSGATHRPRLKEVLVRAISLGGVDAVNAARRAADVLIEPKVGGVGMLDFRQLDRVIEAGRRAARDALEAGMFEALR